MQDSDSPDGRGWQGGNGSPGGDNDIAATVLGDADEGLATAAGPGQWMITPEAEPVLRDLGVRGDIIKTIRTRSGSWHRRLHD
jgi:hypothetical protein